MSYISDYYYSNYWEERLWGRWYSYTPKERDDFSYNQWLEYYIKTVNWIESNIPGPYKHARWKFIGDSALFCFRYERDYLLFILRWG